MTTEDRFHGYNPDEFPDTTLKLYGMEKYEAVQLMKNSNNSPDTLMTLLELAWSRGYSSRGRLATSLDNPYTHPEVAAQEFDKRMRLS